MIKKSLYEDELIGGMIKKLASKDIDHEMNSLTKAADHLNSAAELLEELGLNKKADLILNILAKIAVDQDINLAKNKHKKPADPRKIPDRHTRGLNPDKMVKNLMNHGTPFNMADDGLNADDALLDVEIDDNNLEVSEADDVFSMNSSFEDEKD